MNCGKNAVVSLSCRSYVGGVFVPAEGGECAVYNSCRWQLYRDCSHTHPSRELDVSPVGLTRSWIVRYRVASLISWAAWICGRTMLLVCDVSWTASSLSDDYSFLKCEQ